MRGSFLLYYFDMFFSLLITLWALILSTSERVHAQDQGIKLLEPIGNVDRIDVQGHPLAAFGNYFDLLYPWIVGMAAGIAILNALWGAQMIVSAGGDQGAYDGGKKRLLVSLGGLLIVLLSPTILNAINPTFFK